MQQWDQLRIILPHNTFELLTYDTRHGGVIAVKPNPFLECEFATLLLTRALTNGPGCNTPLFEFLLVEKIFGVFGQSFDV